MKTLIAALLLSLSSLLEAREIVLMWDANDPGDAVEEYRVYELTGAGWALLGSTSETRYDVGDRAPGLYEFAVTAVNFWGESQKSPSAKTPAGPPEPPSVPKIEGAKEVALEVSDDLETWRQVAVVSSSRDREFFRVAFLDDN